MKAELFKERVIVWSIKSKMLFDKKFFGKWDEKLDLSLIEACYLFEKKKIKIEGFTFKKFYDYCFKIDSRFPIRYSVFKDLRDKGYPTRTGFKFGCDFRVYSPGVKPVKRGPKTAKEHTKYLVFAVPEGYECSYPELSRAVRLAHNIRANMLWAIVGKKIQYMKVQFFKP